MKTTIKRKLGIFLYCAMVASTSFANSGEGDSAGFGPAPQAMSQPGNQLTSIVNIPTVAPVYTTVIRCGGGNALCPSGWSEVPGSRFIAPAGLRDCGYQNYVTCQKV